MPDRKTLQIRSPDEQSDDLPAIKKKGRGWEISEKRLDALHERAREMRRFSSEAHKALAKRFAEADMGPYEFKRHAVVGSAIVDFVCHKLGMAIDIDEEGENEVLAKRRDKSLEAVGIRVMRIKAEDILERIDDVLPRITAGMRMRIGDKREARAAHRAQQRSANTFNSSSRPPSRDPASFSDEREESPPPDQVRGDEENLDKD
jgi:very-short-patch-repair endonuclease